MDMKGHILAALSEQLDSWEALLARMSEAEVSTPRAPSAWTVKDEIAHLWAWQQRSIARMAAALDGREPQFPAWPAGLDPEAEAATDQVNAWIYDAHRDRPWAEVYGNWRAGFLRFLALGGRIPERELLDASRHPWLEGHPLAFVLVASYDHHQEHLEKLTAWLGEDGEVPGSAS